MQSKYLVPASLLVIGSIGGAVTAIANSQETVEAAMPPMAKPTPMHTMLADAVGEWKTESKIFFMPGTEPEISQGSEHIEMLGELWQISHYKGEIMGQPFEGRSTLGYDPDKEKFVGTWVDTMTASMLHTEGTYDEATKTITMTVEGKNPMTGEPQTEKQLTRFQDRNTRVFEWLTPNPMGGEEMFKMMEVTYTRQ